MSTQTLLISFCRNFIYDYSLPKRQQIHKQNLSRFSTQKDVWQQTVEYSIELFPKLTFEEVKIALGRKWKKCLFNTRYLTHWVSRVIQNNQHIIPEIPVSSCLPCFLERRDNSSKNVRHDIHSLIKMGVLLRVPYSYSQKGTTGSDDYHWGSTGTVEYHGNIGGQSITIRDTKDNMCYRYIVHRDQLKLVIAEQKRLFGTYHWTDIFDKVEEAKKTISEDEYLAFEKKYGRRIRLDCGLRISIDGFRTKQHLEQLVLLYLLKHNNSLADYISKRDQLNRCLTAESKGHYTVKFHYSKSGKMLTGLSIRDWNDFCVMKSNVKKELVQDETHYYLKDVLLDTYTGKRFYDELYKKRGWRKEHVNQYDVKSSVPRILYFRHCGKWLAQNVDLYELIYGIHFKDKLERDLFKSITLPAIFTKSIDKFIHSVKLHFTAEEVMDMKRDKRNGKFTFEDFATWVWTSVHNIFPNIDGTTVFQWESEIMMEVEQHLQDSGIEYEHKFDAFYTTVEILNFDQLLTKCANEYKDKYWTQVGYLPEPTIQPVGQNVCVSNIDEMII